jgi:N-acetylglucosaminyldiphosphoundecaprenol N-acetyl-beta-D-mannosaminyltransferase
VCSPICADIVIPDGSGLNLACKIIGKPLLENVNGTDLFPFICRLCSEKGRSIYFLGAKPGVAEAVKKNVETSYPGIKVAGIRDGYFDREKDSEAVINEINRVAPDILMVAFGAPHQERWIDAHSGKLNAKVCIGVGGLFDFFSGRIPRAPKWMREFGLEWIYRLIQEPGRMWRRYIIGNPLFVFRVIKWKSFMEVKNAEKN